jgi:hypothetical protein
MSVYKSSRVSTSFTPVDVSVITQGGVLTITCTIRTLGGSCGVCELLRFSLVMSFGFEMS